MVMIGVVALMVGWVVLGVMAFAAFALAVIALVEVGAKWRQRRRLDAKIRHLAYEGELILASERKRRERAA